MKKVQPLATRSARVLVPRGKQKPVAPRVQHAMPDWMRPKFAFLDITAENKEAFFERIAEIFPPTDSRYQLVERAYDTAKEAFRDILRDEGVRYFEHLRATALIAVVYLRVRDADVISALLLHDIVEDIKSWTHERVAREFNQRVSELVWWVTKPADGRYPSKEDGERKYHRSLRDAPRMAILIKLCDRLHNLLTIWSQDPQRIGRKVIETHEVMLPLAETHQLLIHELEDVLRILEKRAVG